MQQLQAHLDQVMEMQSMGDLKIGEVGDWKLTMLSLFLMVHGVDSGMYCCLDLCCGQYGYYKDRWNQEGICMGDGPTCESQTEKRYLPAMRASSGSEGKWADD